MRRVLPSIVVWAIFYAFVLLWTDLAWAATLTVTKLADTNDGVCDSDCSLREAIGVAGTGDTIIFAVTGTITLTLGELDVLTNITITGPGAGSLTVDGGSVTRILRLDGSATLGISGLTFAHGVATSIGGGAILSTSTGTLAVTDMIFSQNSVSGSADGGAISTHNTGPLFVIGSVFNQNSASGLGGGAVHCFTSCTVTRSAFTGNSSTFGAAIEFNAGTDIISQSSFSGNNGGTNGTIIHFAAGNPTVSNVTFCGNTGDSSIVSSTDAVLNNVTISDTTNRALDSDGNISVANSVIAGVCFARPTRTITSSGHNIDSGNTCGFGGMGDQINTAPNLGACTTNIGTANVLTACPNAGSLAIDMGSPLPVGGPGGACALVDERGVPRPQNTVCDVGACEVFDVATATPTATVPTATPTGTLPATATPTSTATPTFTVTGTVPPSSTRTPTLTVTPTPTLTPTPALVCCTCPNTCSQLTREMCLEIACTPGEPGSTCVLVND